MDTPDSFLDITFRDMIIAGDQMGAERITLKTSAILNDGREAVFFLAVLARGSDADRLHSLIEDDDEADGSGDDEISTRALINALELVGVYVDEVTLYNWSSEQEKEAFNWAMSTTLGRTLDGSPIPPKPDFLP